MRVPAARARPETGRLGAPPLAAPAPAVEPMRVPRPDPAAAASGFLRALADDGDRLEAVVRAVAAAAGAPAAVVWRREGGRLLLAHRHGDEALAAAAAAGRATDADRLDGAGAPGLPLELAPGVAGETGVVRLHGHRFALLPAGAAALALGPLASETPGRRERRRLAEIAALATGPLAEALRSAARDAEIAALRGEVEMGRRALGSTIDEQRSFALLLDLAISTGGAKGGLVAVRAGERFRIVAGRDLPDGMERLDLTPGAGVLAEFPGVPGLLVVDGPQRLSALGVEGLLAVAGPVGAARPRLVFGLLSGNDAPLPPDCAGLLETIVAQAALVLESGEAARAAAGRHVDALRGLCTALDARSPETAGHHELVARVAGALALRLGVPESERRDVVAAARVHDVGLLASNSTLAAEFAHPSLGADMVSLVPGAASLAPLVRAHHEWWDGFGFPNGLVGEAIPRPARMLAAAELYAEALQGWGRDADPRAVADEIAARRGTQLDPDCADAMVTMIEELT